MNNQSGKIPNQSESPKGAAPPNAELSDPATPSPFHWGCSQQHLTALISGTTISLSWGWISEFKPHHAPELSILTQESGIHWKFRIGEHELKSLV